MAGILIGEGSKNDKNSIQLSTKRGRWIDNIKKKERLPDAMLEAEKYAHKNCPGIVTRSLSSSYNCVGMVFAARRVAVDPDQLVKIFSDDEYERVYDRSKVQVGDIVVYKKDRNSIEIEHVGVIIKVESDFTAGEIRIQVLSQWGFDGEYLHYEDNVPALFGNYREYYSERKLK